MKATCQQETHGYQRKALWVILRSLEASISCCFTLGCWLNPGTWLSLQEEKDQAVPGRAVLTVPVTQPPDTSTGGGHPDSSQQQHTLTLNSCENATGTTPAATELLLTRPLERVSASRQRPGAGGHHLSGTRQQQGSVIGAVR